MQIRYIVQRTRPLTYPPGTGLVERPPREENSIFAEGVGRVIIGIFNVVLGIVLLSLSAAALVTYTADYDDVDYKFDPIGWGIWSGAVTIISGVCGVASRKIKLMVFVFLGISLVSLFSCIGGCIWATLASYNIYLFLQENYNSTANNRMYLYMFMSISFVIQAMASLTGSVFTWSTLRKLNNTQHVTQVETICTNNTEEISTSNLDFPNFSSVTSPPSQETLVNGPTDLMQNSSIMGS